MHSGLAILAFIALAWVHAPAEGRPVHLTQQTVTVPTPPSGLPSFLPQAQALGNCLMNCDTRSGICQGSCSVGNSPVATLAPPTIGSRPDPGALSQCYGNCTTQQLTCKQACNVH